MTVADASPLITFARAGRFKLLHELLVQLLIPRAVHDEVVTRGEGRPGMHEVAQASWIEVVDISKRSFLRQLPPALGRGEREAIVLAKERSLPLYSDDRRARSAATNAGVLVFGTLALLERAKRTGQLTDPRSVLESLFNAGLRLRTDLYQSWLQRVND